jgi:AraC-like DNA-binding protein
MEKADRSRKPDGLSRSQRAKKVRALVDEGYSRKQIRELLGISQSYVQGLLADPEGLNEKKRKQRYRNLCVDCGGFTSPSAPGRIITRCWDCARQRQKDERTWTPGRIIADIQEWNRLYGEPPRSMDWLYAERRARLADHHSWPPVTAVQREFGTWSNALEAAGFERRTGYERTEEWKDRRRKWSGQQMIEKIQEWTAEYGSPPMSREWRKSSERWPTQSCVCTCFGTWNNAIRAAGFEPRPPGYWRSRAAWESNGNERALEVPSFDERPPGKSLFEVVDDLERRRNGE